MIKLLFLFIIVLLNYCNCISIQRREIENTKYILFRNKGIKFKDVYYSRCYLTNDNNQIVLDVSIDAERIGENDENQRTCYQNNNLKLCLDSYSCNLYDNNKEFWHYIFKNKEEYSEGYILIQIKT